ncbi:MAG: hypothetical protein KBT36_10780 [Kurthia sp.]|nr:hypothetical protein [Candidatus Kurthia equi]
MAKKSVYFWDFQQTENRYEFYLKLQDKRLKKMYEDGIIYILLHSKKTGWLLRKPIHTFELKKSKKEGLTRLGYLGMANEFTRPQDCLFKPAREEKFNSAINFPCNALIAHKFNKGMPLPKLGFTSVVAAEQFLKALNEATEMFLSEHHELWEEINF